jgi:hypothetical protein
VVLNRKTPRKDPMAVLWAASHRNVLTQVARECDVTPQFCHYVLYGQRKSKDGRVERQLKKHGAPVKWAGNAV